MQNLRTFFYAVALVAAVSFGVAQAREVNVQKFKLEKSLEMAYTQMQKEGKEPCEAFMTLYNGIKEGNYVYDHTLVCEAVRDLDVLKHHGRVSS